MVLRGYSRSMQIQLFCKSQPHAQRLNNMKLPPFTLDRFLDGREHAPYNLAGSVCNQRTVADILALEPNQQDALLNLPVDYQPYMGRISLREEIAQTYADNISVDHVMVTVGAQEGLFALFNILLNAGDHVIVQTPCYQLLNQVVTSLGCLVDEWAMDDDVTWDFNKLESLITDKTRLMIINTPHNPTGHHFSTTQFDTIIELARQHGCYLLSDEVYRYLEHNPDDTLPSAVEVYEKAISVSDMSKTYGLPGTRTAWLVSQDQSLLHDVLKFKDYITITGSAVGQFLAEIAVRNRQTIINENIALLRDNIMYFKEFASRQKERLQVNMPNASTTTFIKFKDETDAEVLALRAFETHDILIAPGSKFGNYPNWARIGFGNRKFKASLNAFEEYLNKL